jgi:hypothetical protein
MGGEVPSDSELEKLTLKMAVAEAKKEEEKKVESPPKEDEEPLDDLP